MRKGLIFLLGIVSFLGINNVSADEIYLEYDTNINEVQPYIEEIGYDKINESINKLIQHYNETLSTEYPYYIISLTTSDNTSDISDDKLHVVITAFDDTGFEDYFARYFDQTFDTSYILVDYTYSNKTIQYEYDYDSNNISLLDINDGYNYLSLFDLYGDYQRYNVYNYYYSNFDLYYRGDIIPTSTTPGTAGYLSYLKKDDILHIPNLDNPNTYSIYQANTKFLIEPYYLYDDNFSLKTDNYTTINLNEYAYVALTLKDYNTIPDDNFSLYTNIYVKGQVCITPVYNYGLTERKDILTGTQVEGCGIYSPDFILDRMYILRDDVKNHAIYYLKPYDTSKENIVKIDFSKFNITYISEENKDNPQVTINGKVYPTIPYDDLTDTSTKSEEEGYTPGNSCALGDLNCFSNSSGLDINNLFSKPLETLETIWDTISSVFKLITEFISLLPPIMQGFLYLAFTVGISVGIIKIIL